MHFKIEECIKVYHVIKIIIGYLYRKIGIHNFKHGAIFFKEQYRLITQTKKKKKNQPWSTNCKCLLLIQSWSNESVKGPVPVKVCHWISKVALPANLCHWISHGPNPVNVCKWISQGPFPINACHWISLAQPMFDTESVGAQSPLMIVTESIHQCHNKSITKTTKN